MKKNSLRILKASAGSGKTYALVQEYLGIVLRTESLDAFSRVMAMTFTNKAALEMKERVISGLVDLSFGGTEKEKFLLDTAKNCGLEPPEIREKASKVLKKILHNYSELSIQTIDKFNLRLVRTFTRDLDLPGDFELVLDSRELIEKTIDTLIDSIGAKGKEQLSKLLIDFARVNSEDELSWDFRNSLLEFVKLSEREEYIPLLEKLTTMDFSQEQFQLLTTEIGAFEKEYNRRKQELLQYVSNQGWSEEHFISNKYIFKRLAKLPSTPLLKLEMLTDSLVDGLEKIVAQGHKHLTAEFAVMCLSFYQWVADTLERFKALTAAKKSFYQLALLRYITTSLKEIRLRDNVLQIAEINSLIAHLIQSESAPFIYERIGNRYDNYLLDEFQDTSRLQWLNLIPLLHESMSHGHQNLIVGDTKQAIYRFRNGLVEQFAALPEIYNPEGYPELSRKSAFFEQMSDSAVLKDNWRSKQEIVTFNNALFQEISELLPEKYQSYYGPDTLHQHAQGSTGGFVYVEAKEIDKEDDEEDLDLRFIDKAIAECLNDGYSPGDLCVLARKAEQCSRWANYLMDKGFFVLSDEGMKVKQSSNVRLLVAYIKLRHKPYNREFQTLFTETYCTLFSSNPMDTLVQFTEKGILQFDAFANHTLGSKDALFMRYENLYDLAQLFMRLIEMDELSDPYLHYFCNMLLQYDLTKGPNLGDFVAYFEEKGYNENVPLPERSDAITIMTVHKSKGLEFPVVILPNVSFNFSVQNSDQQIMEDTYHNFVYIARPSPKGTSCQIEAHEKLVQAKQLDETNLFYVACTRPSDRLYLNASGFKSSRNLDSTIRKSLKKLTLWDNQEDTTYRMGARTFTPHARKQKTIFTPEADNKRLWFPDISLIDQESLDEIRISKEVHFGKLVHHVMERMSAPDQLIEVIQALKNEALLGKEEEIKLQETCTKIVGNPDLASLIFPSKSEQLLNEREIVISATERIRPDRVIIDSQNARVIDFKTGIPRLQDEKQIRNYATALKEIGYGNCTSWLVYTDTLNIKQVG
jgi:ATP-dependent exoDNAse (exonuclease V) beta subunit